MTHSDILYMRSKVKTFIKKVSSATCSMALIISCGKEIETTNDNDSDVNRRAATASTVSLTVKTQGDNLGKDEKIIEQSGWAKIPPRPEILNSVSDLVYSKISFNINKVQGFIQQGTGLVCHYISMKTENGFDHKFTGCEEDIDNDGIPDELNYIPGDEIAILKDKVIKLEIHSSNQEEQTEVTSDIEVDWL